MTNDAYKMSPGFWPADWAEPPADAVAETASQWPIESGGGGESYLGSIRPIQIQSGRSARVMRSLLPKPAAYWLCATRSLAS